MNSGREFLDWKGLTTSVIEKPTQRTKIYYFYPYSANNEQINGQIRRKIPKGSAIDSYLAQEIQVIEDWLNHYPSALDNEPRAIG